MIDEADIAEIIATRMRQAFYLGVGLGLMLGFWTTMAGMLLAWGIWQWWLA